jgi:hypothetical protein
MLLGRQIQLRLPMGSHKPKSKAPALPGANAESQADRQQIDQLLSTRDVVRITGKDKTLEITAVAVCRRHHIGVATSGNRGNRP